LGSGSERIWKEKRTHVVVEFAPGYGHGVAAVRDVEESVVVVLISADAYG